MTLMTCKFDNGIVCTLDVAPVLEMCKLCKLAQIAIELRELRKVLKK